MREVDLGKFKQKQREQKRAWRAGQKEKDFEGFKRKQREQKQTWRAWRELVDLLTELVE